MATFPWCVAEKGYQWVPATAANGERCLQPLGEKEEFREYVPLDKHPCLFREFASTPTTPDGVLSFAKTYGLLGFNRSDCPSKCPRPGNVGRRSREAEGDPYQESLGNWTRQIQDMQKCVNCWASRGSAGDPAMSKLNSRVSSQLQGRVRVAFSLDEKVTGFVLEILPVTLLGALWLQLAQSISGNKTHRACLGCGAWFEVSLKKFRPDKLTCSVKCRGRVARWRKKARRLAKEGQSTEAIAKQIGFPQEVVKGWLEKKTVQEKPKKKGTGKRRPAKAK